MDLVITLESYNDIFDDFDPRPFNERALSADFINVLHDRLRNADLGTPITMIFTMPKKQRSRDEERIIEKRLKEYFKNSIAHWKGKGNEMVGTSLIYILAGFVIYMMGGLVDSYIHVLRQYLLIPSWFLTWSAIEILLLDYPKTSSRKEFNKYMERATIAFKNEEYYKA
jgi:hypothetical protein